MIYAGCDLGTIAAKVVIIENTDILAHETLPYKTLPKQAAIEVIDKALSKNNISMEQINYVVATGFGKKAVPYADEDCPDIICLGRAIRLLEPEVRTVIDMGGHTIRAFNISDDGKIIDSTTNEKCAAGTGKFIQVMAKALELPIDQLGPLKFQSKEPVSITSQCGVFAESEVITYINEGKGPEDIVAGIARSVASKASSLVRRISVDEKVAMVGGVAKNSGVVKDIEEELELKLAELTISPQIYGALGAALMAKEKHASTK